MTAAPVEAHPAATVVLLRESADGCEVLLVQRSSQLSFHGGSWVFPGGRLDASDYVEGGSADIVFAARRAAVREAQEEAGVIVTPEQLVLLSRWVTPEIVPKRFDTWFFVAPAGTDAVQVDGGEIRAYRWMAPARAIAAQQARDLDLPPPTFVTLNQLSGLVTVRDTLAAIGQQSVETYLPRVHSCADGPCTVYHGDVAYDDGDTERPGPRHRLVMAPAGWRYERAF